MSRSRRRLAAAGALLLALMAALPFAGRYLLWRLELNPVLRGRLVAERAGCLGCHDPAAGEIPNPGSRWGSVPRFGGGNAFMYVEDRRGLEEFIRFGAPAAWRDDPRIRARLEAQRIRMPAYDDRLDDREIADLVAWVAALDGFQLSGGEAVATGRRLAAEHGCTACHGVEGAGGRPNPGSLGGFVPGFAGGNFPHLVEDRDEFAEWIRTGTSERLAANPLVTFFWRRQQISMPAYGDELDEEQIDALWEWVQAIGSER